MIGAIRRSAVLALALAGLTACAPAQPVPPSGVQTAEASCAARGGQIQPVGRLGLPTCVVPYADAGKACTDKAQCQGACILAGTPDTRTPVVGACQKTNVQFGCFARVEGGKANTVICVD